MHFRAALFVQKMRMNTMVKKTVFGVLMTSEDCMDAFEKLLRLGLRRKTQDREIVFVLVECCIHEKVRLWVRPVMRVVCPAVRSKVALSPPSLFHTQISPPPFLP